MPVKQIGTDLIALNAIQSVGSKPDYPSDPTRVTLANGVGSLGGLQIADQLVQARDRG